MKSKEWLGLEYAADWMLDLSKKEMKSTVTKLATTD
jgi:hypothetical protein